MLLEDLLWQPVLGDVESISVPHIVLELEFDKVLDLGMALQVRRNRPAPCPGWYRQRMSLQWKVVKITRNLQCLSGWRSIPSRSGYWHAVRVSPSTLSNID